MGSGLSMTSVNKIKELAEAREYSLALEIIDSQDLTKSLNPQFVRLCGDIYIANGRYNDARKALIMAHRMAPEAKRVIYSLVELYLRMGYKQLAEFYFNLYMFDAEPNLPQTSHMNYIYSKSQGCPLEEIETLLFPVYSDMMDYDWSFELYLLMKLQGKKEKARSIADDYMATYKNEPNVTIIEEIEAAQTPEDRVKELFYIYAIDPVEDNQEELEELRQEEQSLMEADNLRMNPKEAEIQIMFDDNEKVTLGAKLKYKKHIREQEKLAKKAEQENEGEETSADEDKVSPNVTPNDREDADVAEGFSENAEADADVSDVNEDSVEDINEDKKNIFKKLFSKFKKDESEAEESDSEGQQIEEAADKEAEMPEDTSEKTEEIVETDNYEESVEEPVDVTQSEANESDNHSEEVETEAWKEADEIVEDEESEDFNPTVGDSVMQEIYGKKKISIKTELGEDTFANYPEEDFSEHVHDTGNPFHVLYAHNTSDEELEDADVEIEEKEKVSSFSFEEAQLEPESLDEYQVDDFSSDSFNFDFSEPEDENSEPVEEPVYENSEEVCHDTTETVDSTEYEAEETTINEYIETDTEETQLTDMYTTEDVTEENWVTDTDTAGDVTEESWVTDTDTDTAESDAEETDIQSDGCIEEVEYELEINVEEEATFGDDISSTMSSAVDSMKNESVYESIKNNAGYNYPEFKTTLFPEYGKDVAEVENNFDEIMTRAQDKINENLMKEEQMQREAEALLASLGIDLGGISSGEKYETRMNISNGSFVANTSNSAVADAVVKNTGASDELQFTDEQTNYSPSRDELKASLKIDSVKKSILKHIKEYR